VRPSTRLHSNSDGSKSGLGCKPPTSLPSNELEGGEKSDLPSHDICISMIKVSLHEHISEERERDGSNRSAICNRININVKELKDFER
jgi:hypothetical protein